MIIEVRFFSALRIFALFKIVKRLIRTIYTTRSFRPRRMACPLPPNKPTTCKLSNLQHQCVDAAGKGYTLREAVGWRDRPSRAQAMGLILRVNK
jgi:hypothetical protein